MKIQGTILDEFKNPIQDVNIVLLSSNNTPTTIGIITDKNGSFTLNNDIIKNDSIIQISFVGYYTILIKASELHNTNVILKSNETVLEAVTLVGSGKKNSNKFIWAFLAVVVAGGTYYYIKNEPKKVLI